MIYVLYALYDSYSHPILNQPNQAYFFRDRLLFLSFGGDRLALGYNLGFGKGTRIDIDFLDLLSFIVSFGTSYTKVDNLSIQHLL